MRRGWKLRLLALLLLAIFWILVVPNADLDPATPLSLEAFFFVAIALCCFFESFGSLDCSSRGFSGLRELGSSAGSRFAVQAAPLRR